MAQTKQQATISIDSLKQIGVLAEAKDDGLLITFDTEGEVTPSTYVLPEENDAFGSVMFKRDERNNSPRYLLSDNGYFSPSGEDVVITIHVTEYKRRCYQVTFNAYRRERGKYIDPQYLGSKVLKVQCND